MKKFICIILSFVMIFICCSCSNGAAINKKERFSTSFLDVFDTASTIIAYDNSQQDFDAHVEQFHQKLNEYNQLYDIYKSYDGVVNLHDVNNEAKNNPVKVDRKIIDLLEYGKYVYELSDKKTNICFGSVLSLWHECRQNASDNPDDAVLPDTDKLESASGHTNFDDLIVDKDASTVYFADSELKLDVGAIAKGYAVNEVCKWAKENLWSSAAISIGGNVYTFGYKNDDGKSLWNIGIENPDITSDEYLLNVKITDLSVVTSGDYQRYYTVDGKKYCHIINPDTLMPSDYVASVSVITPDSALGDALSTTLFNMPIDEGVKLVESMDDIEAVWVDKDFQKTFSSGFEKYITK